MIPIMVCFGAPILFLFAVFIYYGIEADKMFEKEREQYEP